MSVLRKNPLFAVGLAGCVLLALAEGGLIFERWWTCRSLQQRIQQKRGDLQTMAATTPAPTRENAKLIESDLAKAEQALATMQAELKGRGPLAEKLRAAKAPAARPDAYFDLAAFVEKMRELAKKNDVDLRPDAARFGFAAYANEGPEPAERIEPVFRQRQVAQYLVEALLEARPRGVLSVKREPALTKEERDQIEAARAAAAGGGADAAAAPAIELPEGPDYFAIPGRASARVPGYVAATGFRFVFTGQTTTLRAFLNRLGTFELPVLVREVEVEPATGEELVASTPTDEATPAEPAAPAAATAAAPSIVLSVGGAETKPVTPAAAPAPRPRASTATPIVSRALSKFTVTVEAIDLLTPPEAPANPAPGT